MNTIIWIVRCSDTWKEGSLDDFISRMLGVNPKMDSNTLTYSFNDQDYGLIEGGWEQTLSVNGKPEVYKGFTPSGEVFFEDISK